MMFMGIGERPAHGRLSLIEAPRDKEVTGTVEQHPRCLVRPAQPCEKLICLIVESSTPLADRLHLPRHRPLSHAPTLRGARRAEPRGGFPARRPARTLARRGGGLHPPSP